MEAPPPLGCVSPPGGWLYLQIVRCANLHPVDTADAPAALVQCSCWVASWPALRRSTSSVPPDRVGVSRQLRLGDTLKPTTTGFDLDLSRPSQHKTSAAFGPTITAVPALTAKLLTAWLGAIGRTGSAAQPHVFVPGAGFAEADIVRRRTGKQRRILLHDGNRPAQLGWVDRFDVDAVDAVFDG